MVYAENLKVYCGYAINGILDMELTASEGRHGKLAEPKEEVQAKRQFIRLQNFEL